MTKHLTFSLNRRSFLNSGSAFLLSLALPARVPAKSRPPYNHAAGIQLYTMQSSLVKNFAGTLDMLGRIGYREVEPVGLLGHDPKAYRSALDAAGLSAPSVHVVSKAAQELFVGMASGAIPPGEAWPKINAAMNLADIESIMEYMFEQSDVLGNEYLVLASADSSLFESQDGIAKVVAAYTRAGDLCHGKGLKFAFHPHLAEFKQLDGTTAVDRILAQTDPEKVLVELDFFWAAMANVDIPRLLERHRGRIHLGHVKDMAKSVVVPAGGFADLDAIPASAFEDIGYGQLNYRKWIPLARKAGMRHFFVERDQAPDPLGSARRSYPNLRQSLA
jgi:sugar phosphate isomerase/epimerase